MMKYTLITVYGIPKCDTVKKARTWLSEQGLEHVFHDFKKQGLPEKNLDTWLKEAGWEAVLNRKGTSWRKLSPEEQLSVDSAASARPLLLANPTLVKRPVIEWQSSKGVEISVGFQPNQWPLR
jgi:arsenate reductase